MPHIALPEGVSIHWPSGTTAGVPVTLPSDVAKPTWIANADHETEAWFGALDVFVDACEKLAIGADYPTT